MSKLKDNVKRVAKNIEKEIDKQIENVEQKISDMHKNIEIGKEYAQTRFETGMPYPDLQGKRVYNVHFVEYQDGVKTLDNTVFTASSPEWAKGYCKSHLELAVKEESIQDKNWWYFYIAEMEINTEGGENWIAAMDWNGKLATDTYHYDKGYNHQYQREHIIYEVEDCENCAEHEKEEEVKIAEKTAAALAEAESYLKMMYGAERTITKKDGDFYKIWAVNPKLASDMRIADYEYSFLHGKFGLTIGNRILFYLLRDKK